MVSRILQRHSCLEARDPRCPLPLPLWIQSVYSRPQQSGREAALGSAPRFPPAPPAAVPCGAGAALPRSSGRDPGVPGGQGRRRAQVARGGGAGGSSCGAGAWGARVRIWRRFAAAGAAGGTRYRSSVSREPAGSRLQTRWAQLWVSAKSCEACLRCPAGVCGFPIMYYTLRVCVGFRWFGGWGEKRGAVRRDEEGRSDLRRLLALPLRSSCKIFLIFYMICL